MHKVFFLAMMYISAVVVMAHVLFPLLAYLMAAGMVAWATVISSVTGLSAVVVGLFIVSGAGVFVMISLVGLWMLGALMIFPFVFSILFPLFVLVLFVAYAQRRRDRI